MREFGRYPLAINGCMYADDIRMGQVAGTRAPSVARNSGRSRMWWKGFCRKGTKLWPQKAPLNVHLLVYHAILSKVDLSLLERMAGTTGLEPATSAVTV